jgi:hypothetical protein
MRTVSMKRTKECRMSTASLVVLPMSR